MLQYAMRLSMLLIASILWASPARAQDAAAPVSPGQAATVAQVDAPLTWQDLHKASLHRKNWGRFVTVIGVLGVGLSLSMIAYEFSVMPQNSSDQYCSLGCEMNLMMGTFYGITGLGMLGTGIGMLIRSFNLGQLSSRLFAGLRECIARTGGELARPIAVATASRQRSGEWKPGPRSS